MDEIIELLCQSVYEEDKTGNRRSEAIILKSFTAALGELSKSHESYVKHIPKIIGCFEDTSNTSLPYSLKTFQDLYAEVMELPIPKKTDLSVMDLNPNDSTPENYKKLIQNSRSKNETIRISELIINTDGLSELMQKELISTLIHKLQIDSDNLNWTSDQIENEIFDLAFLRALCISINNTELFYFTTSIFLDRLYTSGFHQPARDICEEILIASFKDNLAAYGFFACFRVYANSGIINSALIYANLCLTAAIRNKTTLSSRFFYEIIFQTIKFFRNVKLYPLAVEVYQGRPKNMDLTRYERHSLDSTYFTCKLSMKDKGLASELFDYLNKEREEILDEGENGCTPWLITMYNLKRLGTIFKFDGSGLETYISLFEAIVPPQKIKSHTSAILGDLGALKELLKSTLLKLNITRSKDDFVYDNKFSDILAGRLADASFKLEDLEGFLLAAEVSVDPIVNFKEKERKELGPLDIKDVSPADYYKHFPNPITELSKVVKDQSAITILLNPEDRLYQLYHFKNTPHFRSFDDWDITKFRKWCHEFMDKYQFETTTKDKWDQVRQILREEYEEQAERIKDSIPIPGLMTLEEASDLLVLYDRSLSEFPFNLFLDVKKDLIALKQSVANIISSDWLSKKLAANIPSGAFTKSIWIPTEEGDFRINLLYGKLEDSLPKQNFTVFTNYPVERPVSSVLNVVTSHGAKDISEKKVISPSHGRLIHDLDKIIGPGRILIFLVCYSGSQKEYFFRNEIASLVKKYLTNGYDAVIAPFWALNLDVPEIWLPKFVDELEKGADAGNAVLAANLAVHDIFPTPSASLCMHLYGNPYFRVDEKII